LINVLEGEECRVALLENNVLEELYIERAGSEQHVGNIYKAVVTNIEPSIQAAFVDFGGAKNGFLHASDVIPSAWHPEAQKGRKRRHPLIQDVLRRGQQVVVQLTREGVGKKGPSMTTYLSLPGKYVVLMPGIHRHGVSRKIEDEGERDRLRKLLDEMELPKDIGFIVRTAGIGQTKKELQRDLNYLMRLWKTLQGRVQKSDSPPLIYQESDLVIRVVRDVFTTEITRALVDDDGAYKKVCDFLNIVMPRAAKKVKLYTEREPLFHRHGIESQIERIYERTVPLPEGVDTEHVDAQYAHGVLTLRLAKTPQAATKRIEVKVK
jgi:ribonuclease E